MIAFLGAALAWVIANYILVMEIYLAGGVIYALVKWIWTLMSLRGDVLELTDQDVIDRYPNYKDDKTLEAKYLYAKQRLAGKYFEDSVYPPQASRNKGLLFVWAAFWPFNLVYTLFADVAKSFFTWTYRRFAGMLDGIAKKILPE